jgi:hypothetical protein
VVFFFLNLLMKFFRLILLFVCISAKSQVTLNTSLVACYALNGNATEPINGLNGTVNLATAVADRFGNSNSALSFSGLSGCNVVLPNSSLLKANAVSVSCWAKPTVLGGVIVFAQNSCSSYFEGYEIFLGSTGIPQVVKSTNACSPASQIILAGTTALTTGTWYHLGFYAGPDSLKLYINGVLNASMANSNPLNYGASANVVIAGTNTSPNYPYNGAVDNVRFYNRKLTNTEFNQLYVLDPSCSVPTSSFSITSSAICPGQSVACTDASFGNPTAWNWQVTGPVSASATVANPVFTFQTVGTYTVSLTTSNSFGAGTTYTSSVLVNPNPVLNAFSTSSAICAGQSLTLVATGANTYTWSGGQQGSFVQVNPSLTTSYSVNGTSINGCTGSGTVVVLVTPLPVLTVASSQATVCQGSTASLSASGATSYSWSSQQTGSFINVTPQVTTIYTVTGTTANCSSSATITVNAVASPTLVFSPPQPQLCQGGNVTVVASGATTYSWSNGITTSSANLNPASSSVYTLSGIASGCSITSTVLVSVIPTPVIVINPSQAQLCQGGVATLTAFGAATYSWSTGQTGLTATVSPLSTTLYTLTGTSGGCSSTATAAVLVSANPTVTAVSNFSVICNGSNAVLTASGANLYSWSNGLNGANISVSPTNNAVYTVTGTSNNCNSTATVSVVVSQSLNVVAVANPSQICFGGGATLAASGAGSYSWNNGAASATVGVSPTVSTVYTVTGTYSNCTNNNTVLVTVIPLPPVTASVNPLQICAGATASLTATGASSYSWNSGQNSASVNISPGSSTTYTVTGTTNGCSKTATVSLQVNPLPAVAAAASSGTVCSGTSVLLLASGANTYSWSSGQLLAGINVSPALTTTYLVTGTNTNNCSASASVAVFVNALPVISINPSSTLICEGNNVALQVSGASSYTWSNQQNTALISVSPMATTVYTVSGTNTNNCVGSGSSTVNVNPRPQVSIVPASATVCSGSSVSLQASGAASYSWSSSQTVSTITLNPVNTGVFSVTGTGTNSCAATATVAILVNPLPVVTASLVGNYVCKGNTATLQASGATTYTWNTGIMGSNAVIVPSVTAVYTVAGTNLNNCINSASVLVTVVPLPSITISATPSTSCYGQTATLQASGAVTYTWSGQLPGPSLTVTSYTPSTYSVIATGTNGCNATSTISLTVNALPLVTAAASRTVVCTGESVTLFAAGANTYTWSNLAVSGTVVASPVSTTSYSVTGTDANGCQNTGNIIITVDACTGVQDRDIHVSVLSVFPNPGSEYFQIKWPGKRCGELFVMDAQGRLVLYETINSIENISLNLSDYSSGAYIVKLNTTEGTYCTKLIKH